MDKMKDTDNLVEKSDNQPRRRKRALTFVVPENAGPRMSPIIQEAKKQMVSTQVLCERSNIPRPSFYHKLAVDDCKLSDFERLAKALGYEVRITMKRKYSKRTK